MNAMGAQARASACTVEVIDDDDEDDAAAEYCCTYVGATAVNSVSECYV